VFTTTFSALAKLLGCEQQGEGTITDVSIDSRAVRPGNLFMAIKGEQFDGHEYVAKAAQQGAVAAIVSRPVEASIPLFLVSDTVKALGEIAAFHRAKFSIPLIGVTGSCGKTTTKAMIASILSGVSCTLATSGTKNNHIGLPLTLLQLTKEHKYAVIEMGANHAGEISYLSQIAKPTIGIITNANPVHIEGFGSIHRIASAKGEIFLTLNEDGIGIVNDDDTYAALWMSYLGVRQKLRFGLKPTADVYADQIERYADQTYQFMLHVADSEPVPVKLNVLGEHNIPNALAAAAACHCLGIDAYSIAKGLTNMEPVYGRLVTRSGKAGAHIIDDSYNANPVAVKAALDILAAHQGEKIFVFADMGELGENAAHYHYEVGVQAREKGIDRLLATGPLSQEAIKAFGANAQHFATKEALTAALLPLLQPNVSVLLKASRSQQLEKVVQAIVATQA